MTVVDVPDSISWLVEDIGENMDVRKRIINRRLVLTLLLANHLQNECEKKSNARAGPPQTPA